MRASQFVVASLLVGIAVVVAPGIRDSFPLPKSLVASTLGLLSVLLIAAVGAFSPAALERRLHWGQASAKIAAALCAAAVLSLVATRSMPHSSDALPALLVGATCLVGWSLLPGTGALLRWLLVPASLVAALGLLQVANIYSPLDIENAGAERLAMTSLVGSVGDLATFLVLPVLIAQFALFDAKAKKNGLEGALAGVALLLCAAALLVSQTLVALTAALAGTFAFWLLALPRRASVRALVGSVVAMVVALVAVAPLRVRVGAKLQQLLSGDINAVLSGRVDGWRVACAEFLEAPWTGVGHGAYVAEFTETKLRLLEQGAPFSTQHRLLSTFGNAHNELLEVAAEWGLAGLVALGLASWWLAGRLRRIEPSAERALAFGGSLAAFVLALGYFPFRLAVSAFPLVLFFSWVARIGSARSEPAPQEPAAEAQLARVRWISIAALIVLAVCVVLTVSRGRDSLAAKSAPAARRSAGLSARGRGAHTGDGGGAGREPEVTASGGRARPAGPPDSPGAGCGLPEAGQRRGCRGPLSGGARAGTAPGVVLQPRCRRASARQRPGRGRGVPQGGEARSVATWRPSRSAAAGALEHELRAPPRTGGRHQSARIGGVGHRGSGRRLFSSRVMFLEQLDS